MKMYHEIATIKDGNARVGYIMKVGDPRSVSKYYIASSEQFNKTVKDGKVQYFEWDSASNSPYIKYSQEELQFMNALKTKPKYGSEYWNNDIVIRKRYIDTLEKDCAVIIIPLSGMKIPLFGIVYSCIMFGPSSIIEYMYEKIVKPYFTNSAFASTIKFGGNNITVSIPLYDLESERFIKYLRQYYSDVYFEYGNLEKDKDIKGSIVSKLIIGKEEIKKVIPHLKKYSLER